MIPDLYKHKNNEDVAAQVLRKTYLIEDDVYELTIMWWNIVKSHEPYNMDIKQTFKIKRDVWERDWELL